MRKIISCILLAAMLCSLVGCGKKAAQPTARPTVSIEAQEGASLKDVLMYQAIQLSYQLGMSAQPEFTDYLNATDEVAKLALSFTTAAKDNAVLSGAYLRLDNVDLETLISNVIAQTSTATQIACSGLLSFTTTFYCEQKLPTETAIYLRFSDKCHVVIHFQPMEDQLIQASVRPLFFDAAQMLMFKHFADASTISRDAILDACKRAKESNFVAEPTGESTNGTYYADVVTGILSGISTVSQEQMNQYSNDKAVLSQASTFVKHLTKEPQSIVLFRLPAGLETKASNFKDSYQQNMARQKAYLSWGNLLCSNYGENAMAANALMQAVITTNAPGIIAQENELPVMVALNLGEITALVTLFPNEYNVYLYSIACLPCAYEEALTIINSLGAVFIQ